MVGLEREEFGWTALLLVEQWLSQFGEETYDGHGGVLRYFNRVTENHDPGVDPHNRFSSLFTRSFCSLETRSEHSF